jgi:TolB protein
VAQEIAQSGAKSVIVFVSADGKEYVATAGARRPTADQRFRIGSVTKTFTATIMLQLVEEGKLRLDGTLADYVPGVVPRGAEITIRHLLQHRSGLANYTDYPSWLERALRSPSIQPIDILRFAGSKPLAFKPGSRPSYSNTNYIALGLVIEKVTGRSYAEELQRRVIDPLGLEHTELPATRRLSDLDDGGYNPDVPWAAGAIVSNAHDLSRFYSALLSGRLLSASSLATMKKSVAGIGLGMFATDLPCGRSWGHDGFIPPYETHVSASEGGDRVAVVSDRGFPGYLPPVGRVLLCAEPPLAAGSVQGRAKIAFVSLLGPAGILYVANADGSGPRWLSLNAIGRPAWSPDGRKIAVVSGRHGPENSEIYVMNADGSGQRRLTRNAAFDRGPAWSPDGRKIAFLRERDGTSGVYVMNADGSAQRRLTLSASLEAPAWSPDGRTLAFLTKRDGNWEIYVVNADGTGQRNLTRNPASDSAWDWSPDGRKIAFLGKRGGSWGLHVMNADGSGLQTLAPNVTPSDPAWSPDGRKIAFVSRQEIYVVNADGSGKRRLTRNSTWDFEPVWSPNGRKIAFSRAGEIYVMNADGTGQRTLTRSPWHEGGLAWSPGRSR